MSNAEVDMRDCEDDLGWMAPKKARTVSTNIINQPKISFNSPNKFQTLAQQPEPTPSTSNINNENTFRPPPIFVKNITNFSEFRKVLANKVGPDNFSCISKLNSIKIMPSKSEHYRILVNYFKSINSDFHTYQLKEDKAYRIVIKNLHHSTEPLDISKELESKGHTVLQVLNAIHPVKKYPLPIFFVDLKQAPNNKEIFEIRGLVNSDVIVEEPRPRRSIVQCHNCQEYGHTRRYCNHLPRCVKCGQDHGTSECLKSIEEPPKCALCAGGHPANYKGCQVHKSLQQLRTKGRAGEFRRREEVNKPTPVYLHQSRPPQSTGMSYARAVSGGEQPSCGGLPSEDMLSSHITSTLNKILQPLLTQLITQIMEKLQHTFLSSFQFPK